MPLVVETGSGVSGANSYVSVADYRAWATLRGYTLPADTPEGNAPIEVAAIKAMDYLELKTFDGEKSDDAYALSWPRKCTAFAKNVIPQQLKNAQFYLMAAVLAGIELLPNVSGRAEDYVIKEKVGPIETTYASGSQYDGQTSFTAVDALLGPLLGRNTPFSFGVYRG